MKALKILGKLLIVAVPLAGIGWTVHMLDPRFTPGVVGLLLWFELHNWSPLNESS